MLLIFEVFFFLVSGEFYFINCRRNCAWACADYDCSLLVPSACRPLTAYGAWGDVLDCSNRAWKCFYWCLTVMCCIIYLLIWPS